MDSNETTYQGDPMSNPADEAIVDLINELSSQVSRCFDSEADKKQALINQIAQLRASMNPVIHQFVTHNH
jgi:hypothetical protein